MHFDTCSQQNDDFGNYFHCYNCCIYGGEFKPLWPTTIVLDPGHGGIYPGAVHYNIREADVNLAIAHKLREKLIMLGAQVIMTRTGDNNLAPLGSSLTADLQARVDVARKSSADIFVSLHADSNSDIHMTGAAGYYPTGGSSNLARAIQTAIVIQTEAKDNGVHSANFYVLLHNKIPSALIEMGFLSNCSEASRLIDDTYQNLLADSICKGIISYFLFFATTTESICDS